MWSVTRCERTEVPPLRDGDNTTQPYRSRTVTTTECVRIVQIPIDIGETNFSVEPIPGIFVVIFFSILCQSPLTNKN